MVCQSSYSVDNFQVPKWQKRDEKNLREFSPLNAGARKDSSINFWWSWENFLWSSHLSIADETDRSLLSFPYEESASKILRDFSYKKILLQFSKFSNLAPLKYISDYVYG